MRLIGVPTLQEHQQWNILSENIYIIVAQILQVKVWSWPKATRKIMYLMHPSGVDVFM